MRGAGPGTGRLTAADVRDVLFHSAVSGRVGYDQVEVDAFLERVQQEVGQLAAERDQARAELARLAALSGDEPAGDGSPVVALGHPSAGLETDLPDRLEELVQDLRSLIRHDLTMALRDALTGQPVLDPPPSEPPPRAPSPRGDKTVLTFHSKRRQR